MDNMEFFGEAPSPVQNVERFEKLMYSIEREGIEELMQFVKKSDFYRAPASTRFHLSCEGGLLQHSLNVYDCLIQKKSNPIWSKALADVPEESLILVALMHDLCKIFFYVKGTKNQKTYDASKVASANPRDVKHDAMGNFIWETVETYTVDDRMPLGHGEKSCIILQQYVKLSAQEIFAIRWHMGFSEPSENWNAMGAAMEEYPLVLALHEADLEATKILEVNS